MKFILLFSLTICSILHSATLRAQTYNYAVQIGNAIELNVTGANGTVQWQESTDSTNWTNISGATTSPYTFNAVASPSGIRYFRAKITDATICPNAPWYSTSVKYRIASNSTQVQVGDWYRGGVVFSVDGSGNGLIAPTVDQSSSAVWGCTSAGYNSGAISTSNGTANTTAIFNACSDRPIAASICYDLVHLGYSDWFLPAIDQLVLMLNKKTIIGNFPPVQTPGGSTNCYWSSTTGYDTWNNDSYVKIGVLSTSGGYASMSYLGAYDYVRAIRSFSSGGPVFTTSSTVYVSFQPETVSMISQPISRNVCKGSSVSFSATALGTSVSHQWKKDGDPIFGANSSWYIIPNSDVSNQGVYTCELSNLCVTLTSNSATLNIMEINAQAGSDALFCNNNSYSLLGEGTTNNSSVSGQLSYSWSPNTGLTDANIANPLAQPLTDQTYILTVRDGLNCYDTDTITLTSVTPISITSQPNDVINTCINSTVNLEVDAEGSNPFFQWKKNGDDILGFNQNSYQINNASLSDEGIYTCNISNYCNSLSTTNSELKVIQLTVDAGSDNRICFGNDTLLQAIASTNHPVESGTISYQWSPTDSLSSATISNPYCNASNSQEYSVSVTDQIGCSISDNIYVTVGTPYQNQEICLVTVDTLTGKNKISWEKVTNVGTSKFKIFKESGTNNYIEIGEVNADLPAEYTDMTSNPEIKADKYKLMVVDTCNNESELSFYHKTSNLVISSNGSTLGLNWTPYVDASGAFIPSSYYIYRGTTPSQMSLLATVNGSTLSYNDINVFDVYYYMIGVKKANGCEINGVLDTISYSNKKSNVALVNIQNNSFQSGSMLIYPNPMSQTATLVIPNFKGQSFDLKIYDITGKVVPNEITTSIESSNEFETKINILQNNLKAGIYFIEIKSDRVYRSKFIVE